MGKCTIYNTNHGSNPVDSNNDLLEANEEENESEMDETNRKENDYRK